jgi:hypothetical protein
MRSLNAETCAFVEELDLAWRYLQLRQRTAGGVGTLSVARAPSAPDVAFPPRVLMPILEAVCLAGWEVDLSAGWDGGAFRFDLAANGAGATPLSASLRLRIARLGEQPGIASRLAEDAHGLVWSLRIERRMSAPRSDSVSTSPLGATS